MMLRRLNDWPERLTEYLRRADDVPFAWGLHDCCRFAGGSVQAITGADVLPADWRDRAQAVQVLRALGGLAPAVDGVLPRLSTPALAQRGDVVLVQASAPQGGRRRWLAVVDGARWWAPSPAGLVQGPMSLAAIGWEVAHG